jgi:hypothetical protein
MLIPGRMGETEFRYPMSLGAGLIASGIWAVASGLFPFGKIVPPSILGLALILLLSFSYLKARSEEMQ